MSVTVPELVTRKELNAWAKEQNPEPRVSLGWFQCPIADGAEKVVSEMVAVMGTDFKPVSGAKWSRPGGKLYTWGATIYSRGERNQPPILVMPDSAIQRVAVFFGDVTTDDGAGFFRELVAQGCECSRIDCTVDWWGEEIDTLWAASKAEDFSPWRTAKFIDSTLSEGGSKTIYFGAFARGGSGVRMYEKGKERREAFDVLRAEYQARHDQAAAMAKHVFAEGGSVRAGLTSWLPGRLDFKEGYGLARKEGNPHAARDCERYAAWEALVGQLPESVPFDAGELREVTFGGRLEWVKRCWVSTLRALEHAMGKERAWEWLRTLSDDPAYPPLSAEDKAEIDLWKLSRSARDIQDEVW